MNRDGITDSTLRAIAVGEEVTVSDAKARRELDWAPRVDFRQLVEMMVDADLARYRALPRDAGVPRGR